RHVRARRQAHEGLAPLRRQGARSPHARPLALPDPRPPRCAREGPRAGFRRGAGAGSSARRTRREDAACMSRIVVASLVRNEADRFWRSALEAWKTFADEIVVLDADSEDDTPEIALDAGAYVVGTSGPRAWGSEAAKRA